MTSDGHWVAIAEFAPPTDREVQLRPADAPTHWLATTWTIFESESDSRANDGLRVSDVYVVPAKQRRELCFATDHESHTLTRSDVKAMVAALQEWLACECRPCRGECNGRTENGVAGGYCCEPCLYTGGRVHTEECALSFNDGCEQKPLEPGMIVEGRKP